VQCHLDALEKKGHIRRSFNQARAIEVIRKPQSMGIPASVVGETLNRFGFGEALANVLKGCEVIG
jgi:SOS-response transcriptional repressor LexA